MGKNYAIRILTIGNVTGYGFVCQKCPEQQIAPGHVDAYYFAARHQREKH